MSLARRRSLTLALVITAACVTAVVRYMHWDDRTLLWLKEQNLPLADRAMGLPRFTGGVSASFPSPRRDDLAEHRPR